jgi:hypothetical protein
MDISERIRRAKMTDEQRPIEQPNPELKTEEKTPQKEEAMLGARTQVTEPKEGEPDYFLAEAQKVLKKYGGQESNIPVASPYWELMGRYRAEMKNRGLA